MYLTDFQKERFQNYRQQNNIVFSNPIVQGFLKDDRNVLFLLDSLDGDITSRIELENRFRKYFFRIRFISFISSTIKYCVIDQMRYYNKSSQREVLIFDRGVNGEDDDSSTSLGEIVLNKMNDLEEQIYSSDPEEFFSSLQNENLAVAFKSLSQRQQIVTTMCYALCYKDVEIAKLFKVSPQAVRKTRNSALKKLRQALPNVVKI